ncbi:hypothetical protein [Singulisphaera sp. PoT]|uniref:hypothetical protein n=1 Tax=Singulisphaera sp. PoT TaxID=3411797 RepID=UPI003BF49D51
MAQSSVPEWTIQTLARHSTPTLTLGVYSHVGLADQSATLAALPSAEPGLINKPFAPLLPHAGDGWGRLQADTGGNSDASIRPDGTGQE